jgi:hypothetical protein
VGLQDVPAAAGARVEKRIGLFMLFMVVLVGGFVVASQLH